MEKLEEVNRRLLENYGRGVAELPLYRIVWSTNQTERRYGTFIKETPAGIYLGNETCEREVPKYPWAPDYWILEWVQPNVGNPELRAAISYEPLWIFKDKNNNPLPYDWEIIEILVKAHQTRVAPKNQAMIDGEEAERKRKESEEYYDQLRGEASPFAGKLNVGAREAIVVPRNYEKRSE